MGRGEPVTLNDALQLLTDAEDACANAVGYVGRANYAERESEAQGLVEAAFAELRTRLSPTFAEETKPSTAAPIDWHKEMRECVGDAAELADRITCTDSDVGQCLARLCNVVTHLLDENKALTERVGELETYTYQEPE
jgi:hypothetical protein